ncbi:unnamed protein product [Trichogramma brassicae]|uniref:Uncharacterized protein n=1 Tax=Trichogramma brassicae TaxID=86971 RepID=A0A6H5HYA0_9HYME|nr:unnamed protein product [Trichogramma brassicae]
MRQGLSDDLLNVIFQCSGRRGVSHIVEAVRQSLLLKFVPENLGLNAITRQNYIQHHVTAFSNRLYNDDPQVPVAILLGNMAKIRPRDDSSVGGQVMCRSMIFVTGRSR